MIPMIINEMGKKYIQKIPQGYKNSPLGIIPNEWEVKKIKEIGQVVTGNTPATSEKENYGDSYLFVSPADLSDLKYIKNTEKKLSLIGFEKSRKLPKGAVLFTCIGSTIGKIGISLYNSSCNQQINAIICNSSIFNEYLYYELKINASKIKLLAGEQAVPIINKSDFERIKILIPPLAEQRKIAEVLSTCDRAIEKQTLLVEKLELRKKGLMQQLLTGKKRLHGFNGVAWKKVKLDEVTTFLSNNSLSRDNLNTLRGSILNIHYGDVLIKLPTIVDVSLVDLPFINEKLNIVSKDYVSEGDIIMADTAEDGTVGKACEVVNVGNNKVVSGLHTILIHPTIAFAPMFLGYYLNSKEYHKQILSIMQGIKVYSITKDALRKTNIKIWGTERNV